MNSPTEAPLLLPGLSALAWIINELCSNGYVHDEEGETTKELEALHAVLTTGRTAVVPRIELQTLLDHLYAYDLRTGQDRNWIELAPALTAALRSLGVEVQS